ncbi:MAG TPA: hypothetical protein V6D26_15380 [Stenomitos sp.]
MVVLKGVMLALNGSPNQSANPATTPFPAVEPLNQFKLTVVLAQLPGAVITPDFDCILAVTHMPQLQEALSPRLVT